MCLLYTPCQSMFFSLLYLGCSSVTWYARCFWQQEYSEGVCYHLCSQHHA